MPCRCCAQTFRRCCQSFAQIFRCCIQSCFQMAWRCYKYCYGVTKWPDLLLTFIETRVCYRICKINKRYSAAILLGFLFVILWIYMIYTCPELRKAKKYATPSEAINKTSHWSHICEVSYLAMLNVYGLLIQCDHYQIIPLGLWLVVYQELTFSHIFLVVVGLSLFAVLHGYVLNSISSSSGFIWVPWNETE